MNNSLPAVLALVLMAGVPAAVLAQSHGGGGPASSGGGGHASSGGGGHVSSGGGHVSSGGGGHVSAPPVQSPRGFSFPHETNVQPIPPPVARPVSRASGASRPPATYTRPPFNGNVTGGPYHGQFHGPVIYSPYRWWRWGWNHGVIWYPAPIYWGGGFWGPFAFGGLSAGLLFGSIIDYQDQEIYPSYEIAPSSPGAELLQNYGLTQTECGPPNLVVIWGPDNSVICAYPNNLVGPGNYELDPATLTIVSQS
jgi:hypothetical protein